MNRQEYYQEPWGGNDDLHKEGCLPTLLLWIIAGIVCSLIGGCKTKYVTVPEYHNVYVEKHDTLTTRDSIYQRDSVYMYMRGDTVWKEKFSILYKDRWRERIVYRDSIKVDSISVPYPVYVKKMRWQDKLAYVGIGIIVCIIILGLFKLTKWLRARSLI